MELDKFNCPKYKKNLKITLDFNNSAFQLVFKCLEGHVKEGKKLLTINKSFNPEFLKSQCDMLEDIAMQMSNQYLAMSENETTNKFEIVLDVTLHQLNSFRALLITFEQFFKEASFKEASNVFKNHNTGLTINELFNYTNSISLLQAIQKQTFGNKAKVVTYEVI